MTALPDPIVNIPRCHSVSAMSNFCSQSTHPRSIPSTGGDHSVRNLSACLQIPSRTWVPARASVENSGARLHVRQELECLLACPSRTQIPIRKSHRELGYLLTNPIESSGVCPQTPPRIQVPAHKPCQETQVPVRTLHREPECLLIHSNGTTMSLSSLVNNPPVAGEFVTRSDPMLSCHTGYLIWFARGHSVRTLRTPLGSMCRATPSYWTC